MNVWVSLAWGVGLRWGGGRVEGGAETDRQAAREGATGYGGSGEREKPRAGGREGGVEGGEGRLVA